MDKQSKRYNITLSEAEARELEESASEKGLKPTTLAKSRVVTGKKKKKED